MAIDIKLTSTPRNYFERLDKQTQDRIRKKLIAISEDPKNPTHSKALSNAIQRSARVGDYRILFTLTETELIVADIGSRGQIYRKLSK